MVVRGTVVNCVAAELVVVRDTVVICVAAVMVVETGLIVMVLIVDATGVVVVMVTLPRLHPPAPQQIPSPHAPEWQSASAKQLPPGVVQH